MIRLPDEPGPVISWMRTLPPEFQFGPKPNEHGEDDWCCGCPLAQYLTAQGAEHPTVTIGNYWVGDDEMVLPMWCNHFIYRFDTSFDENRGSAADALSILTTLEAAS